MLKEEQRMQLKDFLNEKYVFVHIEFEYVIWSIKVRM